jgi:hypothetical protein
MMKKEKGKGKREEGRAKNADRAYYPPNLGIQQAI